MENKTTFKKVFDIFSSVDFNTQVCVFTYNVNVNYTMFTVIFLFKSSVILSILIVSKQDTVETFQRYKHQTFLICSLKQSI